MNSVISYPDRGPWGKSNWRGNTSGYIIKDLIEHFNPKLFVDVCEGSGTSRDVCKDMGVDYVGLDLHSGHDFTKNYVLNQLTRPADMVFSHPPYHSMIEYSGNMYKGIKEGDTSRCQSMEEFLEKSQVMLLNQREATRDGGHYCTLIGDYRKQGVFRSIQSDYIQMMPKSELKSVTVKIQHNCMSDTRKYANGELIRIEHEYLLIWKKQAKSLFSIGMETASEIKRQVASTWRSVLRIVMMKLDKASLEHIYAEVEKVAANLIAKNSHWKAKIRQTLQKHFINVQRGVWAV